VWLILLKTVGVGETWKTGSGSGLWVSDTHPEQRLPDVSQKENKNWSSEDDGRKEVKCNIDLSLLALQVVCKGNRS